MDIRIIRAENDLYKEVNGESVTLDLILNYLRSNDALLPLEEFRFDDSFLTWGNKIFNSLIEYPDLLRETELISSSLHIDANYITQCITKLSKAVKHQEQINVCTAVTGFDCAAGTYGNTLYIGLEWFVNPVTVGVSTSNFRFKHMKMLSKDMKSFVEETIPHELVHLLSEKPDANDSMFRFIEEGRACYVTHLLNPNWDFDKLFPLNEDCVNRIQENEHELMSKAYDEMLIDSERANGNLFSPNGELMGESLVGYYLAYRLFEELYMDVKDPDIKLKQIMELTDGNGLMELLSRYKNS